MKNMTLKKLASFFLACMVFSSAAGCSVNNIKEVSDKSEDIPLISSESHSVKTYENAYSSYKELSQNVTLKKAEMLSDNISTLRQEYEKSFAETNNMLSAYNNEILNDRQRNYEAMINEKLDAAEKAIGNIMENADSASENMAILDDIFSEREEIHLPTATPNTLIKNDIAIIEEIDIDSYDTTNKYAPYEDDDLAIDTETELNDELKAIADELGSARNIYEFVKNIISYETYNGSKKGAVMTFDHLGGNDVDQASLLIGMLRYKGIPARYAHGIVKITPEQAIDITGAADVLSAGRILGAQYRKISAATNNGEIEYFKMERTWVEAYVPYTDYRGAGGNSGESVWLSLDPSFKELDVTETEITIEDTDNIDNLISLTDFIKEKDKNYTPETTATVFDRVIINQSDSYLPASLPYKVISRDEIYSAIPENQKYKISVSVGSETLFTASTAELYCNDITICYEPENTYDAQLIEDNGGIDEVPSYLINVVPTAIVGDKKYRSERSLKPGDEQQMYTVFQSPGGAESLCDVVKAGSVYAIVIDTQMISEKEYTKAQEALETAKAEVKEYSVYSGDFLGKLLNCAGKIYFAGCDSVSFDLEQQYNVNNTRQLALAIFGYELKSEDSFGYIDKLNYGSFYMDVALNNVSVVSYDGTNKNEVGYTIAQGVFESEYEAEIWSAVLDDKVMGISTMYVFAAAGGLHFDVVAISDDNLEEKLAECTFEEYTKQDIRDFVNQGLTVIALPNNITINKWTGTAYIAVDVNTGSASFMLSKGRAGGEVSADVRLVAKENGYENVGDLMDACYNVNESIFIYLFGEGYKDMTKAWAKMAVSGKKSMDTNGYSVIMGGKVIADGFDVLYTSAADYMDYAISSSEENASKMLNNTLENLANLVVYRMGKLMSTFGNKSKLSYGPFSLTGNIAEAFRPDTATVEKMLGSLITTLKNTGNITSEDIEDVIKGNIDKIFSS